MSMSKRLLFERNPLDDDAREQMREGHWNYLKDFTHRIALKRRDPTGASHWDSLWRMSVSRAAKELGIETASINNGLFTRQASERDAIKCLAERNWKAMRGL